MRAIVSEDDIALKIDIESAMRIKNPLNELEPPNSFVLLNVPIKGCNIEKIQT